MSLYSAASSRPPAGIELDPSILDQRSANRLICNGAIVFSALGDRFCFYAINGYGTTGTLVDQTGLDIEEKGLSPVTRLQGFSLAFESEGYAFETKIFARVEDGKSN